MTRKTAIAALFLTAILWSTGGLAFRMMTLDHGIAISGYRSFFAAIFYIIAFRALPKMENTYWFKTSIFAYTLTTTMFVMSNTLTTAANAIVLQYTAPVFTCIFFTLCFTSFSSIISCPPVPGLPSIVFIITPFFLTAVFSGYLIK